MYEFLFDIEFDMNSIWLDNQALLSVSASSRSASAWFTFLFLRNAHLLLDLWLVFLQVFVDVLILIWQDKLKRQMVLVKVVNQIPESPRVFFIRSESFQVHSKVIIEQELFDLIIEFLCWNELSL